MYRFATSVLSKLPRGVQEWIHEKIIAHEPMKFEVQPGSLWTVYPVSDDAREILDRIPSGSTWADVSIFPGETPRKYIFFNFFQVKTDYFTGCRLEVVTVIRDKDGKNRFLILDYFSNAISSDPENLFRPPTHRDMTIKSDADGTRTWRLADLFQAEVWVSPVTGTTSLDPGFSIDANEKIYYAGKDIPNVLEFDPEETGRVVVLNAGNMNYLENHVWTECREAEPVACFMYPHPVMFMIRPVLS